jgi:hypothetical protein
LDRSRPADGLRSFARPLLQPGRPLAVHPVLFAAYAVLFLYAQNIGEAELGDLWPPLVRIVLAVAALLVLGTLLLRDARRAALVLTAAVVAFFAFGHVANLIEPWRVDPAAQMAAWVTLILIAAFVALVARPLLSPATRLLDAIGAVLVGIALVQIVPAEIARAAIHPTARASTVAAGSATTQGPLRDIYYLIFDRYGSNNSLKVGFGIDNDLPDWLTQRGFSVAPLSHANYVRTTLSLAGTLNLDYWNELADRMGPDNRNYGPIHEMLQDHAVARFLKDRGYRYIHLGSWWDPTKRFRIADENLVWEDAPPEFELVLYETTAAPTIERWLSPPTAIPGGEQAHRESALYELRTLLDLVDDPGPKLVTAHVLLPHEPYVFDAQGRYIPKPQRLARPESARYGDQMRYLNGRIRELVSAMLALPEERRPIIVIQADEGPYPPRFVDPNLPWTEATVPELEMKYGIINAFYLPGLKEDPVYPTISSVNTFRLIFSEYFGADLPFLPDRSFVSRTSTYPYDLTEITDLLPTLNGKPPPPPKSVIPGPGRDGRPLEPSAPPAAPAQTPLPPE